jgi:hypothetical protein
MGAVQSKQPGAAFLVAEEHQVLAHDRERDRRSAERKLTGQRNRLPKAPEQIAGGCARASLAEQVILFLGQHG